MSALSLPRESTDSLMKVGSVATLKYQLSVALHPVPYEYFSRALSGTEPYVSRTAAFRGLEQFVSED